MIATKVSISIANVDIIAHYRHAHTLGDAAIEDTENYMHIMVRYIFRTMELTGELFQNQFIHSARKLRCDFRNMMCLVS